MSDSVVTHAPALSRYEVRVRGELAGFAEYRDEGATLRFTHTEIDPSFEGQGLGSALIRFALDDVRAQGRRLVPQCKFVAAYLRRHPELQDLIADEARAAFDAA